jgi:hypothetical protein
MVTLLTHYTAAHRKNGILIFPAAQKKLTLHLTKLQHLAGHSTEITLYITRSFNEMVSCGWGWLYLSICLSV